MNFQNKNILITRSAHQAQEFAGEIERHGGTPVFFPTIEILPPASWDACDRSIDSMYMYDGLIFTSVNGVDFFFRRLSERNASLQDVKSKRIFVVGEKTQQAVERRGLSVTLMPETFTAADLSKKLESEDLHGKTFLFPRGNLGKDMLQDNLKLLGANVDSVIVYQTAKPQQLAVEAILAQFLRAEIDVATFTSPSTFNNFVILFSQNELAEIFEKTKIAVIGPATAKAVRSAGFEPDITAAQSTIESLVEAIVICFESEIPDKAGQSGGAKF